MRTSRAACSRSRKSGLDRRRSTTARGPGSARSANTRRLCLPAPSHSAPGTVRPSRRPSRRRPGRRWRASWAHSSRRPPSSRHDRGHGAGRASLDGPPSPSRRSRSRRPRNRRPNRLYRCRCYLQTTRLLRSRSCLPAASLESWSSATQPSVVDIGMPTTSATVKPPLFLRSLQLLGFRTFARPTEIRFEGGVTAIVGPNGSGKTNIVDSIKWVLGSGQARDLRSRKMEEVIYAGGERRARASYAEVTMVFDNTAGRLPVDYHEVAIKRRIERDGESDYFLNGARVRRRDLIHMLASTGLTVDSYAIIDQRDIETIVVCSPAERRALLEEAAQVRGVKARRQEAAQKLAELAQNLLRLEDLRSEIEPRMEVVGVQAASAREAAETLARLELLRGSIVWEEWREARDAHRRASSQAQSLERRLIEARDRKSVV